MNDSVVKFLNRREVAELLGVDEASLDAFLAQTSKPAFPEARLRYEGQQFWSPADIAKWREARERIEARAQAANDRARAKALAKEAIECGKQVDDLLPLSAPEKLGLPFRRRVLGRRIASGDFPQPVKISGRLYIERAKLDEYKARLIETGRASTSNPQDV